MFDKFGEMNSYEEINELAQNLFNEGDLNSLEEMAKENGIEREFVEMYIAGQTPYLCDAFTAANGKLDIECEDLKPKELMEDWVSYIRCQCMEHTAIALAVRRKGKTLKGCIAKLLEYSFKNMVTVDKDIVKAADIGSKVNKVTFGVPGMGRAKKIIREYYMGK